jgi:phosphohistidine swiveling domain-containing protein
MNILICWLGEVNGAGINVMGGKGANLAELVRAGFAVPPGFVVTTDAYRTFVEANRLQSRILALAKSALPDDPAVLEAASAEIRALFEQATLPGEMAGEIASAYSVLSAPPPNLPVAVRSSATAEDLPGLAFAGQQDTFLNVIGEEAVLEAVRKCWGSLWTARAMAYRARNHIPPNEIALAVVVQKMIASEISGVLFTANPLTGRRDEIVIDASFGLGEAIVSGKVEPDHYVVSPHGWQIVERKLGAKEISIVPRAGGGTALVQHDGKQEQALPDAQIVDLAQMAQRVAEHFASPQDIEWAWADKRPYLLQSRPITSLYPLPTHAGDGIRVYANFNFIQGVTGPLTPLGIDALRLLMSGVLRSLRVRAPIEQILPEAGSRLFLDLTALARDARLRRLALNLLAQTDPGARPTLSRLIAEGRISARRVLTGRRALTLFLALLPMLPRLLNGLLAPEQGRSRAIASAERSLAQARQHARDAKDLSAQLRALESDLMQLEQQVGLATMPLALLATNLVPVVDGWLAAWLGEKRGAALQMTRGLPHNVTTEMDLQLWAVAQTIRSDPDALQTMRAQSVERLVETYHQNGLPPAAQHALADFLSAYGVRGVAEIDLGRPRWRDDPTPILQTLRGYLEIEERDLAPDVVFQRNAEQAERIAAEYVARVRQTRFGWLRAILLGGAIRRIRALGVLREVPLFCIVSIMGAYRAALLDSGRELVGRGELERAEDIFFIPLETLKRFAQGAKTDLKNISTMHRADYEREQARRQVPHILLSTGEAFYEGVTDVSASEDELVGEAVSPGITEGRAHVILDPHGTRLEPGEILVCPATDPGWTPLFLMAGGLVTEIGGMITHGSVVAREYGIPAVVGVHNATTRIKTGTRIRVDGNRGRVMVLKPEEPGSTAPIGESRG